MMEKKRSDEIGIVFSIAVLLFGLPLLTFGIWATATSLYPGRDYTGLGALFGIPIGIVGAVILCGLFPILYKANSKIKRIFLTLIVGSVIASISIATVSNIAWQKAVNLEEQKKQREEALKEMEILKAFEHSETVHIRFSFDYDRAYERQVRMMSKSERESANMKFVEENIIRPIGKQNILSWNRYNSITLYYVAEVTKTGYEKLKNNKNVRWMILWRK